MRHPLPTLTLIGLLAVTACSSDGSDTAVEATVATPTTVAETVPEETVPEETTPVTDSRESSSMPSRFAIEVAVSW